MPGCFCRKSESYTINHHFKPSNEVASPIRRPTIKPIGETNGRPLNGTTTSNFSLSEHNKKNSSKNVDNSAEVRFHDTSVSIFNGEQNIEPPPAPHGILKQKSQSETHLVQPENKTELPEVSIPPSSSEPSLSVTVTKLELNITKQEETIPLSNDSLLTVPSTPGSLSAASSFGDLEDEELYSRQNSGSGSEERPSVEENDTEGVSNRRRSGIQVNAPITDAEATAQEELPVYPKSPEDEASIRKAIEKNDFLSKILSGKTLQDVINAMNLVEVSAKQKLIKQGDKGHEMYVSKTGKFRITVKGQQFGEFSDVRVFGELAILYNAKRLASITAVTAGKVWVLQQQVYQKIVIQENIKEQDQNLKFLQNVKTLNVVDIEILRQVANLLKPEFFQTGVQIIRQGDKGNKFYIITAGVVSIIKSGVGVVGQLGKGKYFGEIALQKEDTRQATVVAEAPGVDCLTLTRSDFISLFGDVEIPTVQAKPTEIIEKATVEFPDIKLDDLKILKTLGVGGFGRVELVQHKKKKELVFALKYLRKIDIIYQQQQEHVYNEKFIQMNCKSPFIARLYRTFKDAKYVYFLMETCLGGDLFSLLHRQKEKRFEDKDAKFLSACVLEAFEYLHSKGIVYRDLKPENLLVDTKGYLKLCDFGFAKKMPARGKTFTFAGTPEYVAPEIVLNKGHDKAVDYWAFGAFIFELLTGRTPFRTGDSSHMRTYNKILQGIDRVNFPGYMNLRARNLIEKLCRPVAAERLGMQRGGTKDIKNHKWYQNFDWPTFQQGHYKSPFKPKLMDFTDTKYFDNFKQDKDYPADELSGWDADF